MVILPTCFFLFRLFGLVVSIIANDRLDSSGLCVDNVKPYSFTHSCLTLYLSSRDSLSVFYFGSFYFSFSFSRFIEFSRLNI